MRLHVFMLTLILLAGGCDGKHRKTDPAPVCGDGVVQAGERCDGDCPATCDDGDPCTLDALEGTADTCDATCVFTPRGADDCASLDGCCPEGCAARGDLDCPGLRPGVALVVDTRYGTDPAIRARLDRYMADHPTYEFHELPVDFDPTPVTSLEDRGGEVKRNWVEVRNGIRDLAARLPLLEGVWVIADSLPLIWRDETLFAVTPSQFKASIYPLVAIAGDPYESFDASVGGFVEVEGVTIGMGRGDSYEADLWGAALVPVAGWGDEAGQLADFFDRNHDLLENPPTARTLLYADTFGFTSNLAGRIDATGVFSSGSAIFLGPNSRPELEGFSSAYYVMVHQQGEDFEPAGSWGCLMAQGTDQLDELEAWVTTTWFEDQLEFRKIGDDRCYYFSLGIRGRSLDPQVIRDTFEAALPSLACAAGDCLVHVAEAGFTDENQVPVDGHWGAFPDQRTAFHELYTGALESGEILYTYISTHGAPELHYFDVTPQVVHDHAFSSLVYELQACSTADLAASPLYLAGTYLFFGEAQAVTGYAQISVIQWSNHENTEFTRFLGITPGTPVVEALFDRDYSMHLYLGDPLLVLP